MTEPGQPAVPDTAPPAGDLTALQARVEELLALAKAPNTRRAYRRAWRHYCAWCDRLGFAPLAGDPQVVVLYVAAISHLAVSTVRQHLAAIALAHAQAAVALDLKHKLVRELVAGLARERGVRPRRQATPVRIEILAALFATGDDPAGRRDRALLALGFGAALRRSELVALDLADVAVTGRGVKVLIRRSKTDPYGAGAEVAVHAAANPALCVRQAVLGWLEVRGREPGPLFVRLKRNGAPSTQRLSAQSVNLIVKRHVARLGLDPAVFAGHSLRAGLATSAAHAGAHLHQIMRQTRHRSAEAARAYLREIELWDKNVTEVIFGLGKA